MAHTILDGLTEAQLKQFRETLTAKAEEIRENLMTAKAGQALKGERMADVDDLAVQSHEEWIFLNRNNIDVMLLREINEALSRIEKAASASASSAAMRFRRSACRRFRGRSSASVARKRSRRARKKSARKRNGAAKMQCAAGEIACRERRKRRAAQSSRPFILASSAKSNLPV